MFSRIVLIIVISLLYLLAVFLCVHLLYNFKCSVENLFSAVSLQYFSTISWLTGMPADLLKHLPLSTNVLFWGT